MNNMWTRAQGPFQLVVDAAVLNQSGPAGIAYGLYRGETLISSHAEVLCFNQAQIRLSCAQLHALELGLIDFLNRGLYDLLVLSTCQQLEAEMAGMTWGAGLQTLYARRQIREFMPLAGAKLELGAHPCQHHVRSLALQSLLQAAPDALRFSISAKDLSEI